MKKLLFMLLCMILTALPFAYAENAADSSAEESVLSEWFELSEDGTVLTVRLPDERNDEMNWYFEISVPEAFELLTQETVGSEEAEAELNIYAASFRSFSGEESHVSLILTYTTAPYEAAASTRVLEMSISAENVISIVSILERSHTAEWLTYDEQADILTISLDEQSVEGYSWDVLILDEDMLEPVSSDTEQGYIGSFTALNKKKAGRTEVILSYGKTGSEVPEIIYTVNMSTHNDGSLSVNWADTFILPLQPVPEAALASPSD